MLENKAVFTPTLAGVLERQGYLREAMEIYSHLLEQMPGHTVFREKVAEIERRLAENSIPDERLSLLFCEWLALALVYRRLKELKTLQLERSRQINETIS
jgi:hypothetical protein